MSKQTPQFRVRIVLAASGERIPTLVRSTDGIPDFDATLWVATALRRKYAMESIAQALRAVAVFYIGVPIDLEARLQGGEWISPAELVSLGEAVKKPTSSISAAQMVSISEGDVSEKRSGPGKIIKLEAARSKMRPAPEGSQVKSETAQIRIHFIREFLWWRINRFISRAHGTKKKDLQELCRHVDDALEGLVPELKSRAILGRRMGLDRAAQEVVLQVAQPDSQQNPWLPNEFIRTRNYLIVLLLIGLGPRRGELLGVRTGDIKSQENKLYILRRPDDINDPRLDEANSKTLDRKLPVGHDLHHVIQSYLILRHEVVLGNRKSRDFLILAEDGTPLSKSGFNRIFQALQVIPELVKVTPHVLRHTWAENLAELQHNAGLNDDQIHRNLELLGGWASGSESVRRYTKRWAEEQANHAGLLGQKKLRISAKFARKISQ